MNAKLNKRERRAAALLAHYATCERLALYLGMPAARVDGKRISIALWQAERRASKAAVAACNDQAGVDALDDECEAVTALVAVALGKLPPGFFVNRDPRGYALKVDNEHLAGRALIEAVRLHTDWGSYGILSPEITGD